MGLGTQRYDLWSVGGEEQAGDKSTLVTTITGGALSAEADSQSFMRFNDWTFNEL